MSADRALQNKVKRSQGVAKALKRLADDVCEDAGDKIPVDGTALFMREGSRFVAIGSWGLTKAPMEHGLLDFDSDSNRVLANLSKSDVDTQESSDLPTPLVRRVPIGPHECLWLSNVSDACDAGWELITDKYSHPPASIGLIKVLGPRSMEPLGLLVLNSLRNNSGMGDWAANGVGAAQLNIFLGYLGGFCSVWNDNRIALLSAYRHTPNSVLPFRGIAGALSTILAVVLGVLVLAVGLWTFATTVSLPLFLAIAVGVLASGVLFLQASTGRIGLASRAFLYAASLFLAYETFVLFRITLGLKGVIK